MNDLREHWERVYTTKKVDEVSWYQPNPARSLSYIAQATALQPNKTALQVWDIGGGDGFLADHLLHDTRYALTVVDIAAEALQRLQRRLGPDAERIQTQQADARALHLAPQSIDIWHDRAVFHFLTNPQDQDSYVQAAADAVRSGGHMVIATFAEHGPEKCSGLPVQRYSAEALANKFAPHFTPEAQEQYNHTTPSGSTQAFTYLLLQRQ